MTSGPDNVNKPIFQCEMLEVEGKEKIIQKIGIDNILVLVFLK